MSTVRASPPQLLVVEDDREIQELVRMTLEDSGYGVTSAASLPESLKMLDERLFHLVLTDLFREPEQSSPIQSIRPLLEEAAPIPVGVMTAWHITEDDPALAHLAFLIHKPFELDDLLGRVDAELHPTIRTMRQNTLVEEFFSALNARDWKLLTRLCAPDIRIALPTSGIGVGLTGYLVYLEQRHAHLPDYKIDEAQFFARPDGIAARYIAQWHSRDGIEHRGVGSMHFRFRSGRIAQIDGA